MEKEKLSGFINRYNLNGYIESVKINSSESENEITTEFVTEEKNALGKIALKKNNFGDHELGIYDTKKLKSLLTVLGDNIDISTTTSGNKSISVHLSDKSTSATFMLVDLSVIPQVPKLKALPEWDIVINLSKDVISKFISAKNALKEVNTFTLLNNKKTKKVNIVIGYSSINSNRISLDVESEDGKDEINDPISFNANYFKEILSANADSSEAKLNVSSKGLAYIKFDSDDYESEYFLTKVDQGDQ